jgi:hypothetical protein
MDSPSMDTTTCYSKTEDVQSPSPLPRICLRGKVHPRPTPVVSPTYPSPSKLKRRPQLLPAYKFSKVKSSLLQAFVASLALCCVLWMMWLILLTIKPNDTVNWIMRTEHFDDGSFWLMVDPPEAMIRLSVCGQAVTAAAYGLVLVKLFGRRHRVNPRPQARVLQQLDALSTSFQREVGDGWLSSKVTTLFASYLSLFRQEDSHAVKIAVRSAHTKTLTSGLVAHPTFHAEDLA